MAFSEPKNLLGNTLRRAGIEEQVRAVFIMERFAEIIREMLGNDTADRIRPLSVRKGVLSVHAALPIVAMEVNLRREEILARINERVSGSPVHTIRFLHRDAPTEEQP